MWGLPAFPLLAICSIGSAVEFCWAAGETVLVPHLAKHGVRQWIISTIYLTNPTLGLWTQPRLGAWSDKIGRRVPFVVGLVLVAVGGIAILLSAFPLEQRIMGWQELKMDATSPFYIAFAFLGFGAADICFDCLLIPGRALLDDLTVPVGRSEEANALFTAFQLGGRLLALLLGGSAWSVSGFGGLFRGEDAHFDACFTACAVVLFCTMLFVVHSVKEDNYNNGISDAPADASKPIMEEEEEEEEAGYHDNRLLVADTQKASQQPWFLRPDVLLCVVQAVGWIGITSQMFFWTAWRGERVGCIDFAISVIVGMLALALLPVANRHFGAATVWLASELFFHFSLISTFLVAHDGGITPRIICALGGINYAVHATNGLLVAAAIVDDPTNRARTIAMVNNCLPMGQLVTAAIGGTIAELLGGFQYTFVCFGFVGCLVTSSVWIVSSRRGLFSQTENDFTEEKRHGGIELKYGSIT